MALVMQAVQGSDAVKKLLAAVLDKLD